MGPDRLRGGSVSLYVHGPLRWILLSAEDIPDEDAIFFANMETACALCQAPAGLRRMQHAYDKQGVYSWIYLVGASKSVLTSRKFEVIQPQRD